MSTAERYVRLVIAALVTVILTTSLSGMTPAMALQREDPKGDSPYRDLDIRAAGMHGDTPVIHVYGLAGRTLPPAENRAYAYVIFTDDGIWAVDSHERQHSGSMHGADWHIQKVSVVDGCLNEVGMVGPARVVGTQVFFDAVQITEVYGAATMELTLQVEDPDNPPLGTECIARVTDVFDTL